MAAIGLRPKRTMLAEKAIRSRHAESLHEQERDLGPTEPKRKEGVSEKASRPHHAFCLPEADIARDEARFRLKSGVRASLPSMT